MHMQSRPATDDPLNAFCKDTQAYFQGAANGVLSGLTFAAKDIFDVAGHITGGGNPDWKASQPEAESTAWAVRTLVESGATMVGKTITDEITRGIFGENPHYGTPVNPRAPGHVPGGSSSGSASAVAGGVVDFALGSDTGGSVRVPASFCGLYGLRPTHGRIPLDGVLLQAPSYDTVGWFARDAATMVRVGQVLLEEASPHPRPGHLIVAQDAFEIADESVRDVLMPFVTRIGALIGDQSTERVAPTGLAEWSSQQQVLQGQEAWQTARDWIDRTNPRFSFEVTARYVAASTLPHEEVEAAQAARREVLARMENLLTGQTILCLPTTASPAPPKAQRLSERGCVRQRNSMLTCIAGTTGAPQINLPLAEVRGLPIGLSLIGAKGSDEFLLSFAAELAIALKG